MKLIILNGTVGAGKSTLATKLHEKFPLSFYAHFDELRRRSFSFSVYSKYNNEYGIVYK